MTEHAPTPWMNAAEGRAAGIAIAQGVAIAIDRARTAEEQAEVKREHDRRRDLVPPHIHAAAIRAMEPGPVTRLLLRHQLQEFTDTTAAYEAGEDVTPGDCWRASLASLLEVPLAEVPHFIHLYPHDPDPEGEHPHGPRWWRESVAWVEAQRPGWTLAAWEREGFEFPLYVAPDAIQAAPDRLIVTGPSPRGDWNHSALYWAATGELAHDPFPDGPGVLDGPGDVAALVRPEWLVS